MKLFKVHKDIKIDRRFETYEKAGEICCFPNGTTSFSSNNESFEFYSSFCEDIKFAKPEDVVKYII